MPSISVILPVYNGEKYLRESVDSILQQTITDFELIIINDASKDGTRAIISSYDDKRIRAINNVSNIKVVKTLNKGLDLAKGEFIARMDADDVAHPMRFAKQLAYLKAHPDVDICGTWVQAFGNDNYTQKAPEKHDDIKAALLFLNVIVHPSVMFRRESFLKHNLRYNEAFENVEDYELWVKSIDLINFATVPEVLLSYRVHQENVSVPKDQNWEVLFRWNKLNYRTFFNKLQISYGEKELAIHANIGFKQVCNLSPMQLREYLNWLKLIFKTNKEKKYFNEDSLQNELIKNIIYISRNMNKSIASCLEINSAIAIFPGRVVIKTYLTIAEWLIRKAFKMDTGKYNLS